MTLTNTGELSVGLEYVLGEPIRLPAHLKHHCKRPICLTCQTGMYVCERCKCAPDTLTTHCSGVSLNSAQRISVRLGKLDYTYKRGWHDKVSPIECE
jgi:hypothetical protein